MSPAKRQWPPALVVLLLGWLFNYLLLWPTSMLSWIGGPIAWYGQFLITLILSIALLFPWAKKDPALALGSSLLGVVVLPILLFIIADPIQVELYRQDTKRLALDYGRGKLPPGCVVDYAPRASGGGAPLACTGKPGDIIRFYRNDLGSDWTEKTTRDLTTFAKKSDNSCSINIPTGMGATNVWFEPQPR